MPDNVAMDSSRYTSKGGINPFRGLQSTLGFRKPHSLLLWAVLGSTMTHFAATRISELDIDRVLCQRAIPGECLLFQSARFPGRPAILVHIGAVLPAALLAILQFVPLLRRKARAFHRVNGYVVLLLVLVGTLSGVPIVGEAFGGTLEMQAVMVLSTVLIIVCLGLAMWYIKKIDIKQHRAWMLRAWAVVGHVVTMRLLTRAMIPLAGWTSQNRFIVRSCAAVDHMFRGNATLVASLYPSCEGLYSGAEPDQHVLIRGDITSTRADHVAANAGVACASSAWVALLLHCIAVEVYLAWTPAETQRLRGVSPEYDLHQVEVKRSGLGADTLPVGGLAVP